MDLDDRKRPKETPVLFDWATPQGWRKGLRPAQQDFSSAEAERTVATPKRPSRSKRVPSTKEAELIKQIEGMSEPLGRGWYRGVLKGVAHVWSPLSIRNVRLLEKVLASMQSAERGLARLKIAQDKVGPEEQKTILSTLGIKSVERINSLNILQQLVVALEEKIEAA